MVFHDANSIFMASVFLTDGYPVSTRVLPPLSPLKWEGDHSNAMSDPSLEHSAKKVISQQVWQNHVSEVFTQCAIDPHIVLA